MIELFLDGKRAWLDNSTTFKLTVENLFFTKSDSYTYELDIPLGVADNLEIFGPINRLDYPKEGRTFTARLVVDNLQLLTGIASITSVNESSVKIQLMGENSAYNYGNKMADTYIDELDLGDWFRETWPDGSIYDQSSGWGTMPEGEQIKSMSVILDRLWYVGPEYYEQRRSYEQIIELLQSGDLGWVAYPTYNSSSDKRHNTVAWKETAQGSRIYTPFIRTYEGEKDTGQDDARVEPTPSFSVQPFIWKMAEIIARATGFSLSREQNALYSDELFRRIFIASTSTSVLCNKCLPHWSVNDWWEEVENMFGVVMSVDYATGTMSLLKREDYYREQSVIDLKKCLDEYETTVDDDDQADISVSNVGYADHEGNAEDILSEEILSNAEERMFADEEELLQWCRDNADDLGSCKNVIFACGDQRRFIYSTDAMGEPGMVEVDMLRDRIKDPDSSDLDIELKIVPCACVTQKADLFRQLYTYGHGVMMNTQPRDIPDGTFDVPMIAVPGEDGVESGDDDDNTIDIQAILEGDEETDSSTESTSGLLYVALINPRNPYTYGGPVKLTSGGYAELQVFRYPRAIVRERAYANADYDAISKTDSPYSLALVEIDGQINMSRATISNLSKVNSKNPLCVSFVADTIPDVGAVFVIRNRRYVCKKIETTIGYRGLDKLMTGYFYEYGL